jgi:hypothetical protein
MEVIAFEGEDVITESRDKTNDPVTSERDK